MATLSDFYTRRQQVLLCLLFCLYENYEEFEQDKAPLGIQRSDIREFTAEIHPEFLEEEERFEEDIAQILLTARTAGLIGAGSAGTQAKRYTMTLLGWQYMKNIWDGTHMPEIWQTKKAVKDRWDNNGYKVAMPNYLK